MTLRLAAYADGPADQPIREAVGPEGWRRGLGSPVAYEIGTERGLQRSGTAAAYIRSIRPGFHASRPELSFRFTMLPDRYDLLMYVEQTTASVLLPF